jgi:hypothetical protein
MWWDRDDDQGRQLRADVRQAAHDLWPIALTRVQRCALDAAEAAELIEAAVAYVSRHLDEMQTPAFDARVRPLLSLHFSQSLRRLAAKADRLVFVGNSEDIEQYANSQAAHEWSAEINNQIDLETLFRRIKGNCRTVIIMRLHHEWEVIAAKTGSQPATIRQRYRRCLRRVSSSVAFTPRGPIT